MLKSPPVASNRTCPSGCVWFSPWGLLRSKLEERLQRVPYSTMEEANGSSAPLNRGRVRPTWFCCWSFPTQWLLSKMWDPSRYCSLSIPGDNQRDVQGVVPGCVWYRGHPLHWVSNEWLLQACDNCLMALHQDINLQVEHEACFTRECQQWGKGSFLWAWFSRLLSEESPE